MKVTNCLYCGNKKLTLVTHRSDDIGIVQCSRCKVMMVEEVADDTESLYTSDYFEKAKGTKNGYTDYLSSPVANLMGKFAFGKLFASTGGNHLDLGSADGSLMEIFKSDGFTTRGLEISKDAVALARQKGLDAQFSRLHSFPQDLPKSNLITAYDLLEHADQPGSVLRGVYENLAEGGCFAFSTLSVKHNDPSDYWFNNSLEHYVYYNQESLTFILTEVFGKGNFGFVEVEINGIAEFWGFAKKGSLSKELKIINQIKRREFSGNDPDTSYLLSLFYDQVAEFRVSKDIIAAYEHTWPAELTVQAKFYNHFYQGHLELAVLEAKKSTYFLPASSVYWQALSYAEDKLFEIIKNDLEANVMNLRTELFETRDQLHALKNSRVIGRAIKVRNKIGNPYTLPKRSANKARRTAAKFVPDAIRLPLMKNLRQTRNAVRQKVGRYREGAVVVTSIDNKSWEKGEPLVSVVIPYYNRADTVDETLQSLDRQTFRNFEVIVVDDKSNDKASIEKLNHLPGVTVIRHKTNEGVARARNNGIAAAKGKYILCLDSDDMVEETYIEKATMILETHPDIALVSAYQDAFGVINEVFEKHPYDPVRLYEDNMVITAAVFRKDAWEQTSGYKSGIGYEDWEFWLTLAENGYWGRQIPEPLFKYRTSMQSRYVEDKDVHWKNMKTIHDLHEGYKKKVRALISLRRMERHDIVAQTAFINMDKSKEYSVSKNSKPNILIALPWMTFGGAETHTYNFCRQAKSEYNVTFMTGLKSDNEWEYKFKEITPNVYHLPNLFDDKTLYLEFLSNYIKTRNISLLHIIHTDFVFEMLAELKQRHPHLRVVVTMFNDRVPHYVAGLVDNQEYIDITTSDNQKAINTFREKMLKGSKFKVLPNGINITEYDPKLFDRDEQRGLLKLKDDELAVFFIGRLSEEKNPDVFVDVAENIHAAGGDKKIRFFMIGDGPMRIEIEKSLKESSGAKVEYLGYQSEVARYLSAADVFVLPSSIEGFPNSILEAMAMKVVVIASRVGAVPDVLKQGVDGYIVEPGSVAEIAKAVTDLDRDRKKTNRVKIAGRKTVESTYSHIKLGQNYMNVYKEALDG